MTAKMIYSLKRPGVALGLLAGIALVLLTGAVVSGQGASPTSAEASAAAAGLERLHERAAVRLSDDDDVQHANEDKAGTPRPGVASVPGGRPAPGSISPEKALQRALAAGKGGAPKAITLTTKAGTVVYEVDFESATVYIDAATGNIQP